MSLLLAGLTMRTELFRRNMVNEGDKVMVVFILLGLTDYDGDDILGVYASTAEAASARDAYIAKHNHYSNGGYDDYNIQSRVVGAVAHSEWEK